MEQLELSPSFGVAFRPSGSLVDRAIARLREGPLTTATVAAEILNLRGNPCAAASAVFALLGTDPRVRVDGDGLWSLAVARPSRPQGSLRSQEWVVVDVETTGGSVAHRHRLIEVAAVRVAEGKVVESFSTLVNPGRPVPRMITSLTGISQEMVAGAPLFQEVVDRLERELRGRIFVGHNAGFDWRFVSAEMERCRGTALTGTRLCTLRLARRIVPHLPSRSLGALAHYFGIPMETHHRALDDAVATAHLLIRFLNELEEREVADWSSLESFMRRSARRRQRRRSAFPQPLDVA